MQVSNKEYADFFFENIGIICRMCQLYLFLFLCCGRLLSCKQLLFITISSSSKHFLFPENGSGWHNSFFRLIFSRVKKQSGEGTEASVQEPVPDQNERDQGAPLILYLLAPGRWSVFAATTWLHGPCMMQLISISVSCSSPWSGIALARPAGWKPLLPSKP